MPHSEKYILNMGPQHPSTHGVLQVELELDGERVLKATPHMGYLHRGIEKLLESRTYAQGLPYTDRLDYVSGMNNNYAFCQTVEKLANIEVPERAEYIRVIMAELNRIASHLIFIGTLAIDLGASTGMIYAFRDREKILDLFDLVCGARMTFHYIRIGGVIADVQSEFIKKTKEFIKYAPKMIAEFHGLLSGNEIFYNRLKGTSTITKDQALALGLTGPVLRASGFNFDLRKDQPYGVYDKFDFIVPTGTNGDNWDRYMVRVQEIEESLKIIEQALEMMPEGEFMAKVPKVLKPPAGEVYHRLENPRGELGFYIVSDGSTKPYRVHVRRPSFINLQALDLSCRKMLLGDVVAVLSTLDPLMGEVDC
ncbi:MAG: NADH-quinone oxidoreductase subunit D [Negativicutes bacterium]|nr:NADH-quinone oxidoreductase subunit D [Negativicutes bacterium]MBP8628766.1 NADH-quinone oxidoreductase subunit D [Negativicutes bacterium]MBP9537480.1 NADH-quinone oxidoreductase subunit D [Negativicutes bacterium]MBP9948816.1 NADH-quinone oxidoreductase subunit D [Negativicutes bacterium]